MTDRFNDPDGPSRHASAPVLAFDITEDGQLSAQVDVTFESAFDAGVLFVHQSNDDYAKLRRCEHGDHELRAWRQHQREPVPGLQPEVRQRRRERLRFGVNLSEGEDVVSEAKVFAAGVGRGPGRESRRDGEALEALSEGHDTCGRGAGQRETSSSRAQDLAQQLLRDFVAPPLSRVYFAEPPKEHDARTAGPHLLVRPQVAYGHIRIHGPRDGIDEFPERGRELLPGSHFGDPQALTDLGLQEHPERDCPPVSERVVRGGLQGVPERMAEVENLTVALLELVLGDYRGLQLYGA